MSHHRRLPEREWVFVQSLLFHGFRLTRKRKNLKKKKGYVIVGTQKEDHQGVDVWVKMPGAYPLIPVQITQRGVKHYRKYSLTRIGDFHVFIAKSNHRLREKRAWCKKYSIAFVLVRDFEGTRTNHTIAWGDVKALRYAVHRIKLQARGW